MSQFENERSGKFIFLQLFISIAFLLAPLVSVYAQNSKVVSAWKYLGYYQQDEDGEALPEAKKAIDLAAEHEKTKDDPKMYYYRGLIYQSIYESEDPKHKELAEYPLKTAYISYKRSLELDQKGHFTQDVLDNLFRVASYTYQEGVKYFQDKDYSIAHQNFERSLNMSRILIENNIRSALDTASILSTAITAHHLDSTRQAKKLFNVLVGYNYPDPAVYQSLSRIYLAEKDTASAHKVLGKGVEQFPENKALIIDDLNLYLSQGEHKKAIEKIQKAIKTDPENPDLYLALGNAYDNTGNKEEAEKIYKKTLELKPDYFDGLYNLGALYFNLGIDLTEKMNALPAGESDRFEEMKEERDQFFRKALPFFNKAYEIDPESPNILLTLKKLYALTGHTDLSEKMEQELTKLGY